MTYVLAGDVGGTKTQLCLYQLRREPDGESGLQEVQKTTYASGSQRQFSNLIAEFFADVAPAQPQTACFGIAGPIQAQRCEATNLPWVIDAQQLVDTFGFKQVQLLNDLEAAAYGMLQLPEEDFVELNPQAVEQPGHKAVIAAGTGLGEAILPWDGSRHFAMPTEGGHCDFGPNSAEEDELLRFLRERFGGHVSGERILAGDGFGNLYDFLKARGQFAADPAIEAEMQQGDRNAVISLHGLQGDDALCSQVMRLFVRLYGAEAGNLALKCLPLGGLYIGGGIGPKIRSALEAGGFMQGFLDKGRMSRAIARIPVKLALNAEAPLLGAAHRAQEQAEKFI